MDQVRRGDPVRESFSSRSKRGFTLIEVTLAIVIGVIMIAGAVLIYGQAKASAGNSRAQAKVASLQALVEDYVAHTSGDTPAIENLRQLWKRKRPDDYMKSPWGGQLGPADQDGTATDGIVDGNSLSPDKEAIGQGRSHIIAGSGDVKTIATVGWTGPLIYYQLPNAELYLVWDEVRQKIVQHKYFAVSTANVKGERWFYVTGGQAGGGTGGESALNVQGRVVE
jgi:prepilin-type N-terminal cleavage/methylation domain-containing protein